MINNIMTEYSFRKQYSCKEYLTIKNWRKINNVKESFEYIKDYIINFFGNIGEEPKDVGRINIIKKVIVIIRKDKIKEFRIKRDIKFSFTISKEVDKLEPKGYQLLPEHHEQPKEWIEHTQRVRDWFTEHDLNVNMELEAEHYLTTKCAWVKEREEDDHIYMGRMSFQINYNVLPDVNKLKRANKFINYIDKYSEDIKNTICYFVDNNSRYPIPFMENNLDIIPEVCYLLGCKYGQSLTEIDWLFDDFFHYYDWSGSLDFKNKSLQNVLNSSYLSLNIYNSTNI